MVLDPELFEMVLEFQNELTLARHLLTVVLVVHRMPESEDELQLPKLNRHVGDIEGATGLKVIRLVYNVTATTGQQHHQHNEFHDIVSTANLPAESIRLIIYSVQALKLGRDIVCFPFRAADSKSLVMFTLCL